MIYSIYNPTTKTTLEIDETFCENTCISIEDPDSPTDEPGFYLSLEKLDDLIDTLQHIRRRKTKAK